MINRNMELTQHTESTDDSPSLWHKCAHCAEVSFRGELERNSFICPKCKGLFPLSIEQRIKLLKNYDSIVNEDGVSNVNEVPTSAVFAGEESINEFPVSLFILSLEAVLQKHHIYQFSESIKSALKKSIPLLSIFPSRLIETQVTFNEIVPVLLQLENLSQAGIPYITIFTETDNVKLSSHLPVGEIVIAECTSRTDNTPRHNPQPALHAPEEQLLPEKNREQNNLSPDISVDCYIPRPELHTVITHFLKFFSFFPSID